MIFNRAQQRSLLGVSLLKIISLSLLMMAAQKVKPNSFIGEVVNDVSTVELFVSTTTMFLYLIFELINSELK